MVKIINPIANVALNKFKKVFAIVNPGNMINSKSNIVPTPIKNGSNVSLLNDCLKISFI